MFHVSLSLSPLLGSRVRDKMESTTTRASPGHRGMLTVKSQCPEQLTQCVYVPAMVVVVVVVGNE